MTSVRPLIIPKLKEEAAKKNDKKPTRDYIQEDEFDASVFLLPVVTRHSVLNRVRKDRQRDWLTLDSRLYLCRERYHRRGCTRFKTNTEYRVYGLFDLRKDI